jgi:hypothetical protein
MRINTYILEFPSLFKYKYTISRSGNQSVISQKITNGMVNNKAKINCSDITMNQRLIEIPLFS